MHLSVEESVYYVRTTVAVTLKAVKRTSKLVLEKVGRKKDIKKARNEFKL